MSPLARVPAGRKWALGAAALVILVVVAAIVVVN